jgi:predicted hotdog family 3-hydroxylacyl-ACP dehydratase
MIDRAWIAAAIPHQGDMCLLDSVIEWDNENIICLAKSHRDKCNPLAIDGVLGITAGIEYAAQAMAVHGALLATAASVDEKSAPKAGYLTSVRDVKWHVERLDNLTDDLTVQAECIAASDATLLYRFNVSAVNKIILIGRASVLIDVEALRRDDANSRPNPS